MNTPICDFVNEYKDKHAVRMHMPGHKGRTLLGPEALDITEIDGADVLYHAGGIIRESEDNASAIFGHAVSCEHVCKNQGKNYGTYSCGKECS